MSILRSAAAGFMAGLLFLPAFAAAARMLAEGEAMPSWRLVDQDGKRVASTDLAGRTYLLWFYPKAGTPGCTEEGQRLRDAYGRFAAAGVEILGVSLDAPEANAAFARGQAFPYRLLSDDGSFAEKVGAVDPGGPRRAKRISYLVGPDGRVRKAYGAVVPATHADRVLEDLARAGKAPLR